MKFYQVEMEALEFMKRPHSLREWADYGFNRVEYEGASYWEGKRDGATSITDEENEQAGLLVWDYKDWDEDGYMYLKLKKC